MRSFIPTRHSALLVAIAASAGCASCGGAPAGPGTTGIGSYRSSHFEFAYTPLDAKSIASIAAAVEAQYARIVSDLRSDSLPLVHVTFYVDHAALVAATSPVAGTVPSWAAGLAIAQDQIHMMSPNAPGWATSDSTMPNLVHEFAHCVSIHLNARIPNNPRWFWESVAIYESGQSADLRALAYMRDGQTPSFASLNTYDNSRVYELGYSIGEFIVTRWGRGALNKLVLNNANVSATLGVSQAEFEALWLAFVRQRYSL
jgi:hypothetical protein